MSLTNKSYLPCVRTVDREGGRLGETEGKSRAANPSLDLNIMNSTFQCNNWILNIIHMF